MGCYRFFNFDPRKHLYVVKADRVGKTPFLEVFCPYLGLINAEQN